MEAPISNGLGPRVDNLKTAPETLDTEEVNSLSSCCNQWPCNATRKSSLRVRHKARERGPALDVFRVGAETCGEPTDCLQTVVDAISQETGLPSKPVPAIAPATGRLRRLFDRCH